MHRVWLGMRRILRRVQYNGGMRRVFRLFSLPIAARALGAAGFAATLTAAGAFSSAALIPAHAQSALEAFDALTNPNRGVGVRLLPESAPPGGTVRVSVINNTGSSLDRATIAWFVDGEEQVRGVALTSADLTMPNRHGRAEVGVRVELPSGAAYEGSAAVSLASLAVVWEGRTYTFPTYAGRARLVPQSTLAAHAVATIVENGRVVPPSDIVFVWSARRTSLPTIRGLGRDSVALSAGSFGYDFVLEVTATAPGGTQARALVPVRYSRPRIIFYERHPLLGMRYDRFADSLVTTRESAEVVAEPMYFAAERRDDELLSYFWEYNDAPARTTSPVIRLRASETRPARANLSLYVEHKTFLRQDAESTYTIVFREP